MNFKERILVVDDEQHLLDGLNRLLGRTFDMTFALGGAKGLDALKTTGTFSVIVTDMRMPEMDGLAFIKEARKVLPNAVYMMLTGNSDQKTAVDAVNDGRVFQFLNKPCSRETLEPALQSAIHQHRLQEGERLLLERTLVGSLQALLHVLNLTHPSLFQRATRVSKIAFWLAQGVKDRHPWQVRVAAALARIGCVALPDELVTQSLNGEQLSSDATTAFRRHAAIGADLLAAIPRLERVSAIVRHQHAVVSESEVRSWPADDFALAILAASEALDHQMREHKPWLLACRDVSRLPFVNEELRNALIGPPPDWVTEAQTGKTEVVAIADIRPGMVLKEDVKSVRGELLIAAGNEVTEMLAERLRHYARMGRTTTPVTVLVPPNRSSLAAAA